MILGLDYDYTYTADPDFWDAVIAHAEQRGHAVVCVTGREAPPERHERQLPPTVPVVCAGDQYKRFAAAAAGHSVDVWIDDCPGTIEPGRKLEW